MRDSQRTSPRALILPKTRSLSEPSKLSPVTGGGVPDSRDKKRPDRPPRRPLPCRLFVYPESSYFMVLIWRCRGLNRLEVSAVLASWLFYSLALFVSRYLKENIPAHAYFMSLLQAKNTATSKRTSPWNRRGRARRGPCCTTCSGSLSCLKAYGRFSLAVPHRFLLLNDLRFSGFSWASAAH